MNASMPKKKSNTGVILLVGGGCAFLVIAIIGVLAAVAIPSFLQYTQRAKTEEARSNLETIARHMEAYRAEFQTYPSAAATPETPPCGVRVMFTPSDPAWTQIGFTPLDPIYYSYTVEGGSERYVIRARGDLDCDGTYSLFERTSDSATVSVVDENE